MLLGLPGSAWRYHRLLSAAAPTDLLFGTWVLLLVGGGSSRLSLVDNHVASIVRS